jgi:hypothetical protein
MNTGIITNNSSNKVDIDDTDSSLFPGNGRHPQIRSMNVNDIPPAQFLGWTSAGTQIWARLKMAGCDVECQFSWDLHRVLMKIRCPQWRLEDAAEKLGLKLKTRYGCLHSVYSNINSL